MDKFPITKAGYAKLEEDLKHLKTVERQKVIQDIAEARAHGDLSENAEYHAAKEHQSKIEGKIQEYEGIYSRAQVIDPTSLSGDDVKFGATVTVVDEDTDEEKTYQIVGDIEADLENGKISLSSPIARGMIGKSVEDSFEVAAPGGARSYEILEVEYK